MDKGKNPPLAKQRVNGEWVTASSAVLVFHFPFEERDAERQLESRPCDNVDEEILKKTFETFGDCTFVSIKSPSRSEVHDALSESGFKRIFATQNVAPSVVKVLFLSHGGSNGEIFTDTSKESIYTKDVLNILDQNSFLMDALKMIYFGPCKGNLKEARLPKAGEFIVSVDSLSVLKKYIKRNLVVFNAAVEGTVAYNDEGGSWMVRALCKALKAQDKEVGVMELCRLVAQNISRTSAWGNEQCSQYCVSPSPDIVFCLREIPSTMTAAKGSTSKVTDNSRIEHYNWKIDQSRGLAPVFVANENKLGGDICAKLQSLGFRTVATDIVNMKDTLNQIISSGVLDGESSLLVVAVCKIVTPETASPELAVKVGDNLVPIREIARRFVAASCPALASRPKVFLFFDDSTTADANAPEVRVIQMKQAGVVPENETCLNHADFLIGTFFGTKAAIKLVSCLGKTGETLQDILQYIMKATSAENGVSHICSTMTLSYDFPLKGLNVYSAPQFEQEGPIKSKYSFNDMIKRLSNGISLVLVRGRGKTRFTAELFAQLVMRNFVTFYINHEDMARKPIEEFLTDLESKINEAKFVIIDWWSESRVSVTDDSVVRIVKKLVKPDRQVIVTIKKSSLGKFMKGACLNENRIKAFQIDIGGCLERVRNHFRYEERKAKDDLFRGLKDRLIQVCKNFNYDSFYPQRIYSSKKRRAPLTEIVVPFIEYQGASAFAEAIARSTPGTIFVLSCDAGMGKTTNLRQVCIHLQRDLEDILAISLDFHRCCSTLKKYKKKMITTNDCFDLLMHESFEQIEEDKKPLAHSVLSEKVKALEVILLLDAFDEICPTYRDEMVAILRLIKETGLKTLVTTRPHEQMTVADALNLDHDDFFKLDFIKGHEKDLFVANAWGDVDRCHEAGSLLFNLKKVFKNDLLTPLNLKMIAESFPDGKLSNDFFNLKDLYKLLIEKNVSLAVTEKLGIIESKCMTEPIFYLMRDSCFALLRKWAIHECFGVELQMTWGDQTEYIIRLPFLMLVNNTVRFVHRTFAEYLVAQQVVKILQGVQVEYLSEEMCKKVFIEEQFSMVRMFVDEHFLCNCIDSSLVKLLFSELVGYICLRENRLNIFKMFCHNHAVDATFFNNRIEEQHPLNVVYKRLGFPFFYFLVSNGSRLEDFVNDCWESFLIPFFFHKCDGLVTDHWDSFFTKHLNHSEALFNALCESESEEVALFLIKRGVQWTDDSFVAAARYGFLSCLKLMFSLNPSQCVDVDVHGGRTALMEAVREDHPRCVEFLLEKGADIVRRDEKDLSSLNFAVENGVVECFKILWERIHLTPTDLNKLLLSSLKVGRKEIFEQLLLAGADFRAKNAEGNTILHIACKTSNTRDLLQWLLEEHNFNVNETNGEGKTPLHLAASLVSGINDHCCLLLRHGADVGVPDVLGRIPLHYAAKAHNLPALRRLLEWIPSSDVNCRDHEDRTPLLLATEVVSSKFFLIVRHLIRKGANLSALDNQNFSILHLLANPLMPYLGNLEELWHRVPLEGRCHGGLTPLMVAARNGSNIFVRLLLDRGANPNLRDHQNRNSAHHAAEMHCTLSELVMPYLLGAEVVVDARCDGGLTPLMLAARREHMTLEPNYNHVPLLLKCGADPSLVDDRGWNCLHHAADCGREEHVRLLLSHVDACCTTNDHETAESLAKRNGHENVVVILQQALHDNICAQTSPKMIKQS